MPELPEIEVLVRHLRPLLRGRVVRRVEVRRARVLRPDLPHKFRRAMLGATFTGLSRRGKYLLFQLEPRNHGTPFLVLGHLGMTGRMFLVEKDRRLPKHAAMVLDLGDSNFVYEDTRYFGRMSLDASAVEKLGPEPLDGQFTPDVFARSLKRSRQAVKVKLLDQSLVAGIGNIYASEALFRARLSPRLAADQLTAGQAKRLWQAVREVLTEAIACGSTVPLNFGPDKTGRLFYFGRAPGAPDYFAERLQVYDRAGKPCPRCGGRIERMAQSGRSTFYCPRCQKPRD
ncbi:MAG TPA: bifunctional DNA-formamidopyrimidine glycosylase/DNA-(apurinic or apyrimidinic site) lyase [Verrucomicrobiae bacterium]|nr:bifunctional DNA-formamidopyrimidine glycosylase/DNA-(apurinic or apyrimidinic site) lyase [Verrucomicrobiae bacterium]